MNALINYFFLTNMHYALIIGILIALCASLLGVTLVLKRFSFIGDGLSHVAFGALSIATVLKVTNNMALVLPITIVAAVLLLRVGQNAKIKGDASLAMLSVSALAFGYLIVNLFGSKTNTSADVCSTLFGSNNIMLSNTSDVILCAVMSILVIVTFILFYRQIFAVTFDESFAAATGVRANLYNLMIAVITAVVIVVAMNLVGSLLVSALVIFPALSAMRVFKSFKAVVICSAIISVCAATAGTLLSFKTHTGSTIVMINLAVFLVFSLIGKIKGGK